MTRPQLGWSATIAAGFLAFTLAPGPERFTAPSLPNPIAFRAEKHCIVPISGAVVRAEAVPSGATADKKPVSVATDRAQCRGSRALAMKHSAARRPATTTARKAAPGTQAAKNRATPAPRASRPGAMPGRAGMIVVLDPESGELVAPTPQQSRALLGAQPEALSRSDEGLVEIHRQDGSVGIDVQGRFQEYVTVVRGRDGKVRFRCIHEGGHSHDAPGDSVATPAGEEQ